MTSDKCSSFPPGGDTLARTQHRRTHTAGPGLDNLGSEMDFSVFFVSVILRPHIIVLSDL